jgi:exosortase/archaeosortase family protein
MSKIRVFYNLSLTTLVFIILYFIPFIPEYTTSYVVYYLLRLIGLRPVSLGDFPPVFALIENVVANGKTYSYAGEYIVARGCTYHYYVSLIISAIIPLEMKLKRKLVYLSTSMTLVLMLNFFRILMIFYLTYYTSFTFTQAHIMMGFIVEVVVISYLVCVVTLTWVKHTLLQDSKPYLPSG